MHIEPGALNAAKVLLANASALTLLTALSPRLLGLRPDNWLKTLLAAVFFSVFMESFHMPVGPSELHFIGASVMYFSFGFGPTLFGFALGLLLQGWLFEPADLVHLAVNSLSLILPLITAHAVLGRFLLGSGTSRLRLNWRTLLAFDALYYSGVVLMVGFWLSLGETATPLQAWAQFAASYIPVVLCEPLLTLTAVYGLKSQAHRPWVQHATCATQLS